MTSYTDWVAAHADHLASYTYEGRGNLRGIRTSSSCQYVLGKLTCYFHHLKVKPRSIVWLGVGEAKAVRCIPNPTELTQDNALHHIIWSIS
jgi:hypothetical protein